MIIPVWSCCAEKYHQTLLMVIANSVLEMPGCVRLAPGFHLCRRLPDRGGIGQSAAHALAATRIEPLVWRARPFIAEAAARVRRCQQVVAARLPGERLQMHLPRTIHLNRTCRFGAG